MRSVKRTETITVTREVIVVRRTVGTVSSCFLCARHSAEAEARTAAAGARRRYGAKCTAAFRFVLWLARFASLRRAAGRELSKPGA